MGKKETKETYRDIKSGQEASRRAYADAGESNRADIFNRTMQADASRGELSGAIGGIGDRAGQWNNFVQTGGYSPEREASIMSNVKGLQELGRTGGLDQEAINRFRGLGGYENFATTGGYTPRDISNIRSRSLAPISSAATEAGNELTRRLNVQGGYTPIGFDTASRAIRRDTTRGIADTSRDAELAIMDRVNAGKQWGIGGLTNSENALQTLRTGNMFRGLTSAGDMEMQLQNSINNYKAMGMSAQDAAARAMADLQASIYGMDVSQLENARNRGIDILKGGTAADLGYYGARNPIAAQPGIGGNIMRGIGAGVGIASNFFAPGSSSAIANSAPFM